MSHTLLPPALLSRLQKRGIVAKEKEPEEEVIAEDYDEPFTSKPGLTNPGNNTVAIGCPNKYNIYHECNEFCFKNWDSGQSSPPPNIEKKYQKLLKKYPLTEEWQEVWEPGVNRYYFWNIITDEVSWLPPGHPNAKISLPVAKLKTMIKEQESLADLESEESESESESESRDSDSDLSSSNHSDLEKEYRKEKGKFSNYLASSKSDSREKRRNRKNDLDPMDPAAYSDTCPRGKWSDGLERKGEDKNGAE